QLQKQQQEIESMMNAIFKGVFVHRYRDVVPEIRAMCMEELGTWIRTHQASFLTDGYLKYLGWTLHDKQGQVRLQCVKALQALYCQQDAAAQLELFTSRFKARMVAMVLDKEPEVALEVVKLLTMMLETMQEALTEEDCCQVYPLVYVSSRSLATAAGHFVYSRSSSGVPGAAQEQFRSSSGGPGMLLVVSIIRAVVPVQLHEHAAYLVDSLWECAGPRLRDWDTYGTLLLEQEPSQGRTAL
ncbi:STAG2 protein, partial [Bucco capensis]|nr:STAG2 protein [Bucco capensis]